MNTRILSKIAAVTAGIMLIMSMTAMSFAADMPPGGASESSDNTIVIHKAIGVTNPTLTKVDGPGIAYTYSVAPATVAAGTSVSGGGNTGTVHAGPANGLSVTAAPTFSGDMTASAAGAQNVKDITLAVDLSAFTAPGIYRYVLTDTTTNAALIAAGMVRDANYVASRFVDVYIVRDANDALVVGGYVVGTDTNNDGTLEKKEFDTEGTVTPGSTDPETGDTTPDTITYSDSPSATADKYNTFNVTLTKNVSGSMGDRNHEFPFAGTVSNQSKYFYVKENAAPTATDTTQTATAISANLKHGETLYISGLSPKATVAYTETNNTSDVYNVTITGAGGATLVAASDVAANGTKALAATAVSNYDTVNASAPNTVPTASNVSAVTVDNGHESVSPTGVVLRYGAALIVLAAGIALLAMNRKAKTEAR